MLAGNHASRPKRIRTIRVMSSAKVQKEKVFRGAPGNRRGDREVPEKKGAIKSA